MPLRAPSRPNPIAPHASLWFIRRTRPARRTTDAPRRPSGGFVSSGEPRPEAAANRNRPIRPRSVVKSWRGTATSANWYTTYCACVKGLNEQHLAAATVGVWRQALPLLKRRGSKGPRLAGLPKPIPDAHASVRVVHGPGPARPLLWSGSPWSDERVRSIGTLPKLISCRYYWAGESKPSKNRLGGRWEGMGMPRHRRQGSPRCRAASFWRAAGPVPGEWRAAARSLRRSSAGRNVKRCAGPTLSLVLPAGGPTPWAYTRPPDAAGAGLGGVAGG
jgi:hypothetical protein